MVGIRLSMGESVHCTCAQFRGTYSHAYLCDHGDRKLQFGFSENEKATVFKFYEQRSGRADNRSEDTISADSIVVEGG
jgi:hypothetical protein